jgi:hypothetical protein
MSSATVPTCRNQVEDLKLTAKPAPHLHNVGTVQAWVSAFTRSLALACSPSSIREFLHDLDSNDPLLSRFGWALLGVVPFFALFGYLDSGAVHTVNPWIKPLNFCISFSSYVWTVSLFFREIRIPDWQNIWSRRLVTLSISVEMLALAAQAWRSAHPHAPGLVDNLIAHITVAMVSVSTGIVVVLFALFRNRGRVQSADAPMVASIRFGILIFLLGNAVGEFMLTRDSLTLGAPDGGPGLSFLSWSTILGDISIVTFLAIHAIQIVPLFAYLSSQMSPRPAERTRMLVVYATSWILLLAVVWRLVQASLDRPLMSFLR